MASTDNMAFCGRDENVDPRAVVTAFRPVLRVKAVACRARENVAAGCKPSSRARAGTALVALAIALIPLRLVADERIDDTAVAAIITEAQGNSEAAKIFYELTDRLGPRL